MTDKKKPWEEPPKINKVTVIVDNGDEQIINILPLVGEATWEVVYDEPPVDVYFGRVIDQPQVDHIELTLSKIMYENGLFGLSVRRIHDDRQDLENLLFLAILGTEPRLAKTPERAQARAKKLAKSLTQLGMTVVREPVEDPSITENVTHRTPLK